MIIYYVLLKSTHFSTQNNFSFFRANILPPYVNIDFLSVSTSLCCKDRKKEQEIEMKRGDGAGAGWYWGSEGVYALSSLGANAHVLTSL